jgi:protein-disulfide isomerase
MRKQLRLFLPFFICAAFFPKITSAKDSAPKIKWSEIIGADASKLSVEQKAGVEKKLRTLKNTYGCKGTLAACMEKGDITARRHAGFVIRMVLKGKDDAYIAKYISLRRESAHPKEIATINLKGRPVHGNPNAPITLVEFECFQCPFCAHLAPKLKAMSAKYKGKIREYFKFFPVRSHPRGVPSALAALAAHRQGKFQPMAETLFKHRADLEDDDLEKYAASQGLDMEKFKKDMKDPTVMKEVEKDKLEGMRIGVDGTPTLFINGKRYQSVYDIREIEDRIEEELDIIEGRIR